MCKFNDILKYNQNDKICIFLTAKQIYSSVYKFVTLLDLVITSKWAKFLSTKL